MIRLRKGYFVWLLIINNLMIRMMSYIIYLNRHLQLHLIKHIDKYRLKMYMIYRNHNTKYYLNQQNIWTCTMEHRVFWHQLEKEDLKTIMTNSTII